MRQWLLPKLLRDDPPRGIQTASSFVPPAELEDTPEVQEFASSVARLKRHSGDFAPHPAFGKLPREQILKIHAAHAAHHLRFLQEAESERDELRV